MPGAVLSLPIGSALGFWQRQAVLDADAHLVERCLGGEETAWEDLVRLHSRRVYGICFRFTGSDGEAQDIAQEVFLRVFQSLKSFRAGGLVPGLAGAAAQSSCRPLPQGPHGAPPIRSRSLPTLQGKSGGARTEGCSGAQGRLKSARTALRLSRVAQAVVLRDLEGASPRDRGRVKGSGTVKSRINRGRASWGRS
jgi:RNA polymerase sigma-70 factor (ECF subfamily)